MTADIDAIENLIEKKLVVRRSHPKLPLFIYNYTPAAVGVTLDEWDGVLGDCRGLILDDKHNVVARPFKKFHNYERVLDRIPANESFEVWEKLDGSLGILCDYEGNKVVATRGSFESEQAVWATKWLEKKVTNLVPGVTWCFEIIYPDNRIVVDYKGYEGLVFLAALSNNSGKTLPGWWELWPHRKAEKFEGITDFQKINEDSRFEGQEGFVVEWQSGFRAKLKLEEYKRLHRLITQVSTRSIWELLRSGKSVDELVERVPEDFKQWVQLNVGELRHKHTQLGWASNEAFLMAPTYEDRKRFAMWAKQQPNPNLLFALLDKKPISDMIWRMIEPKYATPFKTGDSE